MATIKNSKSNQIFKRDLKTQLQTKRTFPISIEKEGN
jgi:hypothetical protein